MVQLSATVACAASPEWGQFAAIVAGDCTTAESGESTPMKVTLQQQEILSGDPTVATQGFGRVSRVPAPAFDPANDIDAACAFFDANGFVILSGCLDAKELAQLNGFFDRTQDEWPLRWGLSEKRKPHHRNQGLIYSQPLLDYPELDRYTRHPRSSPPRMRHTTG